MFFLDNLQLATCDLRDDESRAGTSDFVKVAIPFTALNHRVICIMTAVRSNVMIAQAATLAWDVGSVCECVGANECRMESS